MIKLVNFPLFLAILVTSVIAWEVTYLLSNAWSVNICLKIFFSQDYDENPDYAHVKQQFMNLQAAQRSINKKSDEMIAPVPFSDAKIKNSLSELRQGKASTLISVIASGKSIFVDTKIATTVSRFRLQPCRQLAHPRQKAWCDISGCFGCLQECRGLSPCWARLELGDLRYHNQHL